MAVVPELAAGGSFDAQHANQPMHVASAVYNASADDLEVDVGAGRVDFGGGDILEHTVTTTYVLSAPAASTTYFVFAAADDGSGTPGVVIRPSPSTARQREVRLGSVTTASDTTVASRDDLRGGQPALWVPEKDEGQASDSVNVPLGGNYAGTGNVLAVNYSPPAWFDTFTVKLRANVFFQEVGSLQVVRARLGIYGQQGGEHDVGRHQDVRVLFPEWERSGLSGDGVLALQAASGDANGEAASYRLEWTVERES